MDELNLVRSELKKWESIFVTNNGRKPSKDDIKSSGDEIMSLYKKYDQLKRVRVTIPMWGKELNKNLSDLNSSNVRDGDDDNNEEKEETFRMSISKKLINNMPLQSSTQKMSKPSIRADVFRPINAKENEDIPVSEPTRNNFKLRLKMSDGGFISSSSSTPSHKVNSPLLAIRRSALKNEFLTSRPLTSTNFDPIHQKVEGQSENISKVADDKVNHFSQPQISTRNISNTFDNIVEPPVRNNSTFFNDLPMERTEVQNPVKDDNVGDVPVMMKPKARSTKRKRRDDDDDVEQVKKLNAKKSKIVEEEEIVVDRNVHSSEDVPETETKASRTTTWKKPKEYSTKMSGDNFVRLNMKVKTYRKKGGFSAISARRQMWKQKLRLKFGGKSDGDSSSCFKCGQPGHWAKNCKGKANTKEFDWTMGNENKQSDQKREVYKKVDVGESAAKALEQVSYLGDVVHEKFEPITSRVSVEPMLELNHDGSTPETTREVRTALKEFGFGDFREGQKEAVMNVLCGKSTLVVLSTGSGKSLCYQLPAYLYAQRSPSICLVVSPLVSLMQDQILDLPACLKGACIHNNMTQEQKQKVLQSASDGQLHFLLLSPEMLVGGFSFVEGRGPTLPPVSFACIDEVHCLSDWSHHFRPSYLMICKVLRERFGVKTFLGLTATANLSAIKSICQHFEIENNDSNIIRQAPVPRNLMVTISRDEDKEEMLIELLKSKRFSKCASIIIYCTRREQTSRVAVLVRTRMQNEATNHDDDDVGGGGDDDSVMKTKTGKPKKSKKGKPKAPLKWSADCYHAGLTAVQRKRIQKNFMSGKLRVVVATVAFGMGLDKSDVRGVIHFNLPGTVESYIQEIGRAGRDGIESHCHLFLDPTASDLMELKRHVHAKSLDRITVKKLIQQVFKPCRCRLLDDLTKDTSMEINTEGGDDDDDKRKSSGGGDDDDDKRKSSGGDDDDDKRKEGGLPGAKRICPGHERSLSIDGLVRSLDVKEEGLSTLLCYLELCPQKWIYNRNPIYSNCTIRFYSAQNEFSDLLKKSPALGVLLAERKDLVASLSTNRQIEFDAVELSDTVGIQSGQVKRQLRDLQFIRDQSGCRSSGIVVEFNNLSFHFQAPGDLLDEEIDQVVDDLFTRVQSQESAELYHLHKFYDMLKAVSYKSYLSCQDEVDSERSLNLRSKLQKHLESATDMASSEEIKELKVEEIQAAVEASLRQDVRSFIHTYSREHRVTGRCIARIFHGIHSPCFPSEIWSKVRRFWRSHIDVDFNAIRNIATSELAS